jgi:hypothetical protein
VHHGLILGEDGKKLAKRAPGATVASLRDAGIPGAAVRRYLEELGLPQHDVHYDLPRIRRLQSRRSSRCTTRSSPQKPAPRSKSSRRCAGRGTSTRRARTRQAILTPPAPAKGASPETLERFRELLERANGTSTLVLWCAS